MGLFDFIGRLFSEDARYNHKLYKSGAANKDIIVGTTVGYRPDPWHKQDGYTETEGETVSGNREYSRVIEDRRGKK